MGGRGKTFSAGGVGRRKVPALPADVKSKLDKGKGDRISAKALGLSTAKAQTTFAKKTRSPKKNVSIANLSIGGGNLSKKSLKTLEGSLAGGYKRTGTPILVSPVKGKPGQYAVMGKAGNNRIAYAKLSGYTGKIPVQVVTEGRRNQTKPKAAKSLATRGTRPDSIAQILNISKGAAKQAARGTRVSGSGRKRATKKASTKASKKSSKK